LLLKNVEIKPAEVYSVTVADVGATFCLQVWDEKTVETTVVRSEVHTPYCWQM